MRDALLAVLGGNTHTWMTLSDLSIWLYGNDGFSECRAVRTLIYRLRRWDGVEIVDRHAPWDARQSYGPARAYRLIDAAREAAA